MSYVGDDLQRPRQHLRVLFAAAKFITLSRRMLLLFTLNPGKYYYFKNLNKTAAID